MLHREFFIYVHKDLEDSINIQLIVGVIPKRKEYVHSLISQTKFDTFLHPCNQAGEYQLFKIFVPFFSLFQLWLKAVIIRGLCARRVPGQLGRRRCICIFSTNQERAAPELHLIFLLFSHSLDDQ